ncbi:class I SAM-dependent methyltransferase [Lamprocystis purpurea]|jgi:SAM-dependent methyltransferase|uniref:class I SAM-dependent methyltransferase n=1 Tax=Lamprocystis purpurea TaxID=61598 RepID=UPI0009FFE869|nr:methyltransferase domain-containing protein [Lamprocystis purpurea]
MTHKQQQREQHNLVFTAGSREHVLSNDPAIKYIVSWRIDESIKRLVSAANGRLTKDSSILVLCAGEGLEGSILCDLGFLDVTVSDLAEEGVRAALQRDVRLKGLVLDAEQTGLAKDSFDIVFVQDGLHHLQSPVQGLTEMLRIGRSGIVFLEGHDTLICRLSGTTWERNGTAVNYVFRWKERFLEQVASSFLGPDNFECHVFTFWHHNLVYARFLAILGSNMGLLCVKAVKLILDSLLGRFGNQFCGIVLKRRAAAGDPRT